MRTLGKGSFGKVKLALHAISGEKVAIKVLERSKLLKDDDMMRVRREVDILSKVRHPNIVQLYETVETEKYFFFIMEYAEEGELSEYIETRERLSEEEAAKFFRQLIEAIQYLHSIGCAHRDIKPSNILVDWRKDIKLIDFGLGNLYEESEKLKTACGSPCYAAPEIISGDKYDPMMVDVWSSGITLYAMLCGDLPFSEESKTELYDRILGCKFTIPKYLSPAAADLLRKLLVRDVSKRIDIEAILEHPFLKKAARGSSPLKVPLSTLSEIAKLTSIKTKVDETSVRRMIADNEHNEITML